MLGVEAETWGNSVMAFRIMWLWHFPAQPRDTGLTKTISKCHSSQKWTSHPSNLEMTNTNFTKVSQVSASKTSISFSELSPVDASHFSCAQLNAN